MKGLEEFLVPLFFAINFNERRIIVENYSSNSHKSKEETKELPEKHIEKVVNGKVTTKKRSVGKKLSDVFIAEDVNNVKSYIFFDVIVPAVKSAISDVVTNGIDMLLFSDSNRSRRSSRSGSSSYTNYTKFYKEDPRNSRQSSNPRSIVNNRDRYNIDDITIPTFEEAEDVIRCMNDIIDDYHFVSVADLYDMVGLQTNYIDNRWGWYELPNNIRPQRCGRDGYLLSLPRPVALD